MSGPKASPLHAEPSPSTNAGATGHHRIAALAAWLLCALAYLYTANGIAVQEGDRNNAWHHYEYLVDGFLSGHLYLSESPAPELLALPDPYDPIANKPYRLWDASLYRGRYYLYYGPSPAVLLMLPWKLITGTHLPQRIAAAVFALSGLAALTLLVLEIRARCFPTASAPILFWAIVIAGHVSWLPVILRRPAFWELPIVCAVALFWWSLYFLWLYFESGRRSAWAVAMGTALAFALGARPTYLITAAILVLAIMLPFERRARLVDYLRRLLPAALPLALGIAVLLWYNQARFGAPFEFGQRYQLWGMEERTVTHFSLGYLPFNVRLYLLSVPEFSPYFPFVRTAWSNELPAGYIATEEMHGLLFGVPALLLGLFAWRNRAVRTRGTALRVVILSASAATLLAGGILFCFAGACSRYIVELLGGWTLVVAVGVLALWDDAAAAKRGWRVVALAAIAWSLTYVWLASFEFRAFARRTQPRLYHAVAHTLNYPSQWVAEHQHQQYGPVLFEVRLSPTHLHGDTVLAAAGRHGEVNQLVIERKDATHLVLKVMANLVVIIETPPLTITTASFPVALDAPWLYPPAAHPYWDCIVDPEARRQRQEHFVLIAGPYRFEQQTEWLFDPMRFDPIVQTSPDDEHVAYVTKWQRVELKDPAK